MWWLYLYNFFKRTKIVEEFGIHFDRSVVSCNLTSYSLSAVARWEDVKEEAREDSCG